METTSVIGAIVGAWSEIMAGIVELFAPAEALFWSASNGLTFLGGLAVISVAIGVVMLVIGIIQNFLHLRS